MPTCEDTSHYLPCPHHHHKHQPSIVSSPTFICTFTIAYLCVQLTSDLRLLTSGFGSTSIIVNSAGEKLWEDRFYPFGDIRYTYRKDNDPDFPVQTDMRYTGQRLDAGVGAAATPNGLDRGLYFYNARFYDSSLGRFLQPDTIVPEPGNPQALNRYTYANNNALRYTDPSGHAPQKPGDPDNMQGDCATQWCWENRWHRARGYVWSGGGWSLGNSISDIIFYDAGILYETVGEAGVTFAGGWDWDAQKAQMAAIGQGIVKFGHKLNSGLAQLQNLLGGGAALHHVSNTPWYCFGAPACALPPGTNSVYFSTGFLTNSTPAWISMTTVHELAHVIDWRSRIALGSAQNERGNFSMAWHGTPLTNYARRNAWENWAEAVTVWVFGELNVNQGKFVTGYKSEQVEKAVSSGDLSQQMNRIEALLSGWY